MNPTTAPQIAQAIRSSPRALANRYELFYVYNPAAPPVIAQGATATFSLTLQADYNFACYSLAASIIDKTASTTVLPDNSTALIQIQDTGAGANWFANPVGLATVFGSAQLPFNLPVIRIVAKTATLSFTITNTKDGTAAAGVTYYLSLIGTKLGTSGQGTTGILG